jgi:hypothetical protein
LETTINNTVLERMRLEKLRQERAAVKQSQEEERKLTIMLTPMLEWFAENGEVETALQAREAMHELPSDWTPQQVV